MNITVLITYHKVAISWTLSHIVEGILDSKAFYMYTFVHSNYIQSQHTFDARLLTVPDKGTPFLMEVVTMTTAQ